MTSASFSPRWLSHPGETVATVLRFKGLSVADFANQAKLSAAAAEELLNGQSVITDDLAVRLASAVGSSASFWLERDRQYRKAKAEADSALPAITKWVGAFAPANLPSLGWIPKSSSTTTAYSELLDFFDVSTIDEWHEKYISILNRTRFRKSAAIKSYDEITTAWLRQGEIQAEEAKCAPWDKAGFEGSLKNLRTLSRLRNPEKFLPRLVGACAKSGVALVVTRCPRGCAASGAARFLDNQRALLMLSFRHLSDDHFWFSFFHEAGHLLLHGGKNMIDDQATDPTTEIEREANAFAEECLIPSPQRKLLAELPLEKKAIRDFALKLSISPGIVVGQLQNKGRIPHSHFNVLKVRYRWV